MFNDRFNVPTGESQSNKASKNQFMMRVTAAMAAFTASSLFISSNMAQAAPEHPGADRRALRLNNPDMSRRELRQLRHSLPPMHTQGSGNANPIVTPAFVPNPDPNFQQPRHEIKAIRQAAKAALRDERQTNKLTRVSTQQVNHASQSNQTDNESRAGRPQHDDRNSRFVTQEYNGQIVRLDSGANLDLTTTDRNITLGDKLFGGSAFANITVGGESKRVYAGSKVTAAEYIAVKQSLNGEQSIVLDSAGKAIGGQVNLDVISADKRIMKADSLTVAEGVTAIGDLDRVSTFKLDGNLTNYGSIYAVNTRGNSSKAASINADNISNESGALISSDAGSQFGNQATSIDLNLSANNKFSNLGNIESSGSLTISAPTVANGGTVSASRNITLDSPVALNVDNSGGTFRAGEAINIRSTVYDGNFNSAIVGGDFLSNTMNLNTGHGTAEVDVNQLTGKLNGTGTSAHVTTHTSNLLLGDICLEGDPTFFNTGDITLTGSLSANEAIAIIAENSILSQAGANIVITATDGAGGGSNIFMIAGFKVSTTGAPTGSPTIPPGTKLTAGQTVTIADTGSPGGNIDLTSAATVEINSNATTVGKSGGNVTLLARSAGAGTGKILLPLSSTIDASGEGNGILDGLNGDITIAAGSNDSATTIQVARLFTFINNVNSGNISISTAQPSAGAGVTFNDLGQITSGSFSYGSTLANPGILIGDNADQDFILAGNDITIRSGAGGTKIDLDDVFWTTSGTIALSTLGDLNVHTFDLSSIQLGNATFDFDAVGAVSIDVGNYIGTSGGNFTVDSGKSVTIEVGAGTGQIATAGGDIDIRANDDVTLKVTDVRTGLANNTNGGNITVYADADENGVGNLFAKNTGFDASGFGAGTKAGNLDFRSGDDVGQVLEIGFVFNNSSSAPDPLFGNVTIGSPTGQAGDIYIGGLTVFTGDVSINGSVNNHDLHIYSSIDAINLNINMGTGAITHEFANLNVATLNVTSASYTTNSSTFSINSMNGGTIGIYGGAGSLNLSTAFLNSIVTETLEIGSFGANGDVTLGSSIDLSGTGPGKFDLNVFSGAKFNGGGKNITLGDKSLLVSIFDALTIGDITSTTGNISLFVNSSASLTGDINAGTITSTTGTIQAFANQNINLVAAKSGGAVTLGASLDITVTGNSTAGDDFSITTSTGNINVNGITVSGPGADIFLTAIAGDITTNGALIADPIIMIAGGDISLGGSLTAKGGILAVAGKDIVSTTTLSINGTNPTGAGGAATFVAGAEYQDNFTGFIQIDAASATGGKIDLTGGGGLTTLTTAGGNGAGGEVYLIAYSNGTTGGQVLLPTTSSATTTGSDLASNSGDFHIIAGAVSGLGIQAGSVTTSSATAGKIGSGRVEFRSADTDFPVLIDRATGVVSNTFVVGGTQAGSIVAGDVTARGGIFTATSGSNIGLGAINLSVGSGSGNGGDFYVESTGTDTMDIGFKTGSNYITSLSNNAGTAGGDGGSIQVFNNGATGIHSAPLSLGVTDGNGGFISLGADTGNLQLDAGTYSTSAAGTDKNAGSIFLVGSSVTASGGNVALNNKHTGTGLGGTVSIENSGSAALTLGTGTGQIAISTSGVDSIIDLNIGGNINQQATSVLTASDIKMATTLTGSDVILQGSTSALDSVSIISADTVVISGLVSADFSFSATADGDLTTVSGGQVKTASSNIVSANGNVGGPTSASRFNLDADVLSTKATKGSVFVQNDGALAIAGPSSAGNTFDVLATGTITQVSTTGGISAKDVALYASVGTITLTEGVTGTASVSLRAAASLTNTTASTILSPLISLRSDNGSIGTDASSPYLVDTATVNANAPSGSVFVSDPNTVIVGGAASSAQSIFNVSTPGLLHITGGITAGSIVLTSTANEVKNEGALSAISLTLTSALDISNTSVGSRLVFDTLILNSTGGNVGTLGNALLIDANKLTVNASKAVYLSELDDVEIADLSASGTNANFSVVAVGSIDVTDTVGAGASLSLKAADINVSAAIGAVTSIALDASSDIVISAAVDAGSSISLKGANVDVGGTVTSVTSTAIDASNDVKVSAAIDSGSSTLIQAGNDIIVSATIDSTTSTTIEAGNDITVSAIIGAGTDTSLSADGDVKLSANVTATKALLIDVQGLIAINADVQLGQGDSVTLNSGGTIVGAAGADLIISGKQLVSIDQGVNINGDFKVTSSNAGAQINLQKVQSTGDVELLAGLGTVSIAGTTSGDNVTIASSTFTTQGRIDASDELSITTNNLKNTFELTAKNALNIDSFGSSALTIDGSAGPGAKFVSDNSTINFSAAGDVIFIGALTLNDATNVTPGANNAVVVSNGAVVTGIDQVTLNTCSLLINGTGVITGNPLLLNCPSGAGTIANSSGNVNLTGLNLVFNGQSLAIIASNNVIAGTTTSINLSNGAGNAGDLLVVAGFDFSPATTGQEDFTSEIFTLGSANTQGGNIQFSGLNINTDSSLDAGSVTLIARGGTTNPGSIVVGNISAKATSGGDGGNIKIIGSGGFVTGTLVNTGGFAGTTVVAAATPLITGGVIRVADGHQQGPGQFTVGAATGAGTIANSQGDVTLASNLTFVGLSLTVLAANNIFAGPATSINLSNNAGNGGNLTLIAGYDFTPGTGGQVTDQGQLFTLGAANANGGNIAFGSVNIITSGSVDGGSLVAIANGGAVSAGTIALGTVTTTGGTGAGGDVQIIGKSNITVGNIDTTGATPGGDVLIANAQPTVNGPYTVQNGNVRSGSFSAGAATLGTITTGTIDSGDGIAVLANQGPGSTLTVANYQAVNDIRIRNNGSITLNGSFTSTADDIDVDLEATTASGKAAGINDVTDRLLVNGANLQAFNNISLTNTGMDRKNNSRDQLIFALNSIVETNFVGVKGATDGQVSITMGATGQRPIKNKLPASRFTVNQTGGGQLVLFGKKPKGVVPSGATKNVLTAEGADIVISNFNNKALEFQGSTLTHADPPVASGSASYVNGRLVGGIDSHNIGSTVDLTPVIQALQTGDDMNQSSLGNDQFTLPSFNLTSINLQSVSNAGLAEHRQLINGISAANQLGGTVSATEDNSYMVSMSGPEGQSEASLCSDSDLGVGTAYGVARTSHKEKLVLHDGNVLFAPFQNTVVETQHGSVNIDANSTVLVSIHNNKLAVYNLNDNHKGAVSVSSNGNKLTLAPGNHLTLTTDKGEFAQVNAIGSIPHRNVTSRTIGGARVHTSEFSVASAIATIAPLKAVMSSKHPQAKKVSSSLLKTTAILFQLSGSKDYQHYFKPSVTAMLK